MLSPTLLLSQNDKKKFTWTRLAPIPDEIGFAGAYITSVNGCLVMMGGANFPDGVAPWDGGKKVWTDRAFILQDKNGVWKEIGAMPEPMGYGAVASYEDAIYVAGGSNESGHLAKVYKMELKGEYFQLEQLPDLPHTIANCTSVQVGKYWYILGGIESPDSQVALNNCWRIDLDRPDSGWEVCPNIPGEGRMLSVAGNMNGQLMIASGVSLRAGKREYLRDAYVFAMQKGWQEIAELPESVAAAPSPAWYDCQTANLLIFGGDNGELATKDLRDRHPGFSNRTLCYNVNIPGWTNGESIKVLTDQKNEKTWVPVTTGSVYWQGGIVVVSGEVRPGIRSPQVLFASYPD